MQIAKIKEKHEFLVKINFYWFSNYKNVYIDIIPATRILNLLKPLISLKLIEFRF